MKDDARECVECPNLDVLRGDGEDPILADIVVDDGEVVRPDISGVVGEGPNLADIVVDDGEGEGRPKAAPGASWRCTS